ncbi:MAG: hypothetical protein LW832_06895 [Parachlamydia sp.]|jgi:hypothetical protein|nr:hypothetical protein [Parachlamydia sp.]
MTSKPPLDVYKESLAEEPDCLSPMSSALNFFFQNQPFSMEAVIDDCSWEETFMASEKAIENWKKLLAANLLNYLSGSPVKDIYQKVGYYDKQSWDQSSQYLRVLVALNHWLANMPLPDMGISLIEYGAAPISLVEYAPQLAIPYSPYHLEFGLFLALLAYLTKREDLKEWVCRLAKWQLNTLDKHFKPFSSLFVREVDGNDASLLKLYYLFFYATSLLTREKEFESVSQALRLQPQENQHEVHKLWFLIEKMLPAPADGFLPILSLPEHIYDPSASLVGFRSEKQNVICTLHGANTGLGALKWGNLEVVNFGPQYLPLDNCKGFGIEGNYLSDKGLRKSTIELKKRGFYLKGCVRVVDEPDNNLFQGKFRGIWMDVSQELKNPNFSLQASFLGLDGWEQTAFCFYVKALRCRIGTLKTLLHGNLDSYQGYSHPIYIESDECSLLFSIPAFEGTVQIIPLGDGAKFWGANFLIAYLLHPTQRHYSWEIIPS